MNRNPDSHSKDDAQRQVKSNGSATEIGYRIQIKDELFCTTDPVNLHDGIVGQEWRDFCPAICDNPAGVPSDTIFGQKTLHNLLLLESAIALAWTIIAQNKYKLGLRIRLIRYELRTTWELEREGIVDYPEIKHQLFDEPKIIPLANERPNTVDSVSEADKGKT